MKAPVQKTHKLPSFSIDILNMKRPGKVMRKNDTQILKKFNTSESRGAKKQSRWRIRMRRLTRYKHCTAFSRIKERKLS